MRRPGIAIAAGVALVVAGVYAGASWYAGREAESRIEQFVERVNLGLAAQWPVSEPQPVLRIDEYRRGWFSSRIRYALAYQDDAGRPRSLHFQDDLAHGPLPWAALREGDWRPAMAYSRLALAPGDAWRAWFDGVEGGGPPLTIDSRIAFDGKVHAVWRLQAARVRGEDAELSFGAGRMTVDYDPATGASEARGGLDDLALVVPGTGERLRLQGVAIRMDGTFPDEGGAQAHYRAQAREVSLEQPDAPLVEARDFEAGLDAARTGALTDGRLSYALGQFRVDGVDMGSLEFGASAERLDVEAFQALRLAWERIVAAGGDREGLSGEDQALLRERLRPVLAAGPSLAIDPLSWRNPQGRSRASLAVDFMAAPGDEAGADQPGGGVPNGGAPNGGVPNGSVPNGSVPNGSVPNGGVPGEAAPEEGVPGADGSGEGMPDESEPGADAPGGDVAGDGGIGAFVERAIREVRLDVELSRAMLIETARRVNPADGDRAAAMAGMVFDHFSGRLARAGLVRIDGGMVRIELSYGAGRVVLNGQAMPVGDFLALVSPWLVGLPE